MTWLPWWLLTTQLGSVTSNGCLSECHTYQLRAYLYQARDLISADASGLSDPYGKVIFGNQSKSTKIIPETLCPTWDQTLILDNVKIWGDPEELCEQPPSVVVELFDYDPVVGYTQWGGGGYASCNLPYSGASKLSPFQNHDFLGRTIVKPMVIIFAEDALQCRLNWYPITRSQENGGEILAAFELYMV